MSVLGNRTLSLICLWWKWRDLNPLVASISQSKFTLFLIILTFLNWSFCSESNRILLVGSEKCNHQHFRSLFLNLCVCSPSVDITPLSWCPCHYIHLGKNQAVKALSSLAQAVHPSYASSFKQGPVCVTVTITWRIQFLGWSRWIACSYCQLFGVAGNAPTSQDPKSCGLLFILHPVIQLWSYGVTIPKQDIASVLRVPYTSPIIKFSNPRHSGWLRISIACR